MSKVARSLLTIAIGFGTLTSTTHAADNFADSAGTVFVMTKRCRQERGSRFPAPI